MDRQGISKAGDFIMIKFAVLIFYLAGSILLDSEAL